MKKIFALPGMLVLLAACGADKEVVNTNEPIEETAPSDLDRSAVSGEEDVKTVSGREILITLEQTSEPVKRNKAAGAVKETRDFKEGYLGEPTEELAEDIAVQQIEQEAVYKAVEKAYGGLAELEKIGVKFIENGTSGANQPGIWLGIKNPDERVDELAAILQKQVDAGDILAEPIYIYESAHTQLELNNLVDQAGRKMESMAEAHANPNTVSYSILADTITGALEIGHNFLTESQIKELEKAFPDREVVITQEGTMVPASGEPTVIYSEPAVTAKPSDEGNYIMSLEQDRFLAVAAKSNDFSENGGQEEYYSAILFDFKDAAKQLELGQRVKIEAAGPILESYPGEGRAVLVEVLPTYQPQSADLTEAEVVKRVLKENGSSELDIPAIRSITFNEEEDSWTVVFASWDQETEKLIEDIK